MPTATRRPVGSTRASKCGGKVCDAGASTGLSGADAEAEVVEADSDDEEDLDGEARDSGGGEAMPDTGCESVSSGNGAIGDAGMGDNVDPAADACAGGVIGDSTAPMLDADGRCGRTGAKPLALADATGNECAVPDGQAAAEALRGFTPEPDCIWPWLRFPLTGVGTLRCELMSRT